MASPAEEEQRQHGLLLHGKLFHGQLLYGQLLYGQLLYGQLLPRRPPVPPRRWMAAPHERCCRAPQQ